MKRALLVAGVLVPLAPSPASVATKPRIAALRWAESQAGKWYCFGGTGALELARSGADLKGVVTFHGGLGTPTPDDAKNIKCPLLILHGADSSKEHHFDFARVVRGAGMTAVLYDARGHGASPGALCARILGLCTTSITPLPRLSSTRPRTSCCASSTRTSATPPAGR